jgi:hypothetical protein
MGYDFSVMIRTDFRKRHEKNATLKKLKDTAANQRILYLADKYISDEARAKGEELMRKYDAYYPILRRKPEEI